MKYDYLKSLFGKEFSIKSSKVISSAIGTYEYLVARCVKK
jgi:hypothetical protein